MDLNNIYPELVCIVAVDKLFAVLQLLSVEASLASLMMLILSNNFLISKCSHQNLLSCFPKIVDLCLPESKLYRNLVFSSIAGVSQDLLEKYGLRLIAIDRPGYGQSDPHGAQTFKSTSQDIEHLMEKLNLEEKIWLLGFSMGGAYCWGAARHIPDRLAGIALASPAGNFWWKSIPLEDQKKIVESYPMSDRIISMFNKTVPFPIIQMYTHLLSEALLNPSNNDTSGLSPYDRECLERPGVQSSFFRDREESLRRNKGFGIAKDYELLNRGWDFDLADIRREFKGKKIHVWQGDADTIVPYKLQECVHRAIPEVVDLHSLHNHGHFSWFCFEPTAPNEILAALFGEQQCEENESSGQPELVMV